MADEESGDATEGGLENVIHQVISGQGEVEGEHHTEEYQYRQRIVKPEESPPETS